MSKLKTLKDITKDYDEAFKGFRESIPIGSLKQEAINWIKALRNIKKDDFGFREFNDKEFSLSDTPDECCESCVVVDFIKHFFNIKESDLK